MVIEGKGLVSPASIRVPILSSAMDQFHSIAEERYKRRSYGTGNAWQRGIRNDAIFVGLCGEWAVQNYLKSQGISSLWNPNEQKAGDGGIDVSANGFGIQVKTGVKWIKRIDPNGKMIPIEWDVCVFCKHETNCVYINGWIFAEKVHHIGNRRPQGHFNLEVNESDLEPMFRLVKFLKSCNG